MQFVQAVIQDVQKRCARLILDATINRRIQSMAWGPWSEFTGGTGNLLEVMV